MAGLMNRREVAPVAAMMIEEVELGCLSAGDMNRCLTEGWQQVDQVVSAYDRAVTMQHYPAMTTQRAREVAQTAVDLAPFVSNASSLYELMSGSSPVSGEEANRWMAALGVVPVFGGMIKGAGKSLLEIARAAKAEGALGSSAKGTGGAAGKVDELVSTRSPIRPPPKKSEIDVGADLGIGARPQVSYKRARSPLRHIWQCSSRLVCR